MTHTEDDELPQLTEDDRDPNEEKLEQEHEKVHQEGDEEDWWNNWDDFHKAATNVARAVGQHAKNVLTRKQNN